MVLEQSGGAFKASFPVSFHKVLGYHIFQQPCFSWLQLYTPSLLRQLITTEVSQTFFFNLLSASIPIASVTECSQQ